MPNLTSADEPARYWLARAAEQGYPAAMVNLHIYLRTGDVSDDDQLEVDGIFIAWRQVILQRDLGEIENPNTPGELFRSSPEQVLLIPQLLSKRDVKWLEVQP